MRATGLIAALVSAYLAYQILSIFHEDVPSFGKLVNWPNAGWRQAERWQERLVENGYLGRDCLMYDGYLEHWDAPEIQACLHKMQVKAKEEIEEGRGVRLVERCATGDTIVERSLLSLRRPQRHPYLHHCAIDAFSQSTDTGIGLHSFYGAR